MFPSFEAQGKKPLSASIMVQKYLRPAAVKAGVIAAAGKARFGFHNFRHALATALVKLKVDREDGAGDAASRGLRHDHGALCPVGHGGDAGCTGQFLEQLLGDKIHLLTEKVQ